MRSYCGGIVQELLRYKPALFPSVIGESSNKVLRYRSDKCAEIAKLIAGFLDRHDKGSHKKLLWWSVIGRVLETQFSVSNLTHRSSIFAWLSPCLLS